MVRLRFMSLALGNLFMIKSAWISGLLWLAILRDLRFPIFALIGLVVADGVAWALDTGEKVKREGVLRANAMFASIAVAWLTTGSGASLEVQLGVEIAAAVAAALIAAAFVRGLRGTILPPLGWGFYIVAGVLFTLFTVWTQAALKATLDWPRPQDALGWIESLFRSLGMLLFLPRPEVGVLVALAIVLWSRLMLLTGIVGWISGVGLGLVLERLGLNYLWLLAAHNYFLAGMLLGAVLFLPGRSTFIIAVIAGISASVLSAYFQYLFPGSSYAFLPVPAALTVWLGVGALLLRDEASFFRRNLDSDVAPEVAWWNAAYWTERFGQRETLFAVPLAGPVQIVQGFDGQLSHAGRWRHALDFQRPAADARAAPGDTIWEAPVYAPAGGIVELTRADVPDNPLGISNFAEMWGNYVTIRLDTGGWAMLAHLRQGSVAVAPGMRVNTGTYVGLVGNSGRSPTSHLHLHAQVSSEISASTMPFRLANFMTSGGPASSEFLRWNAAGVPAVGAVVMGARVNRGAHDAVTSMAPGTTVWQVESEGRIPRQFARYRPGAVVRVRIFLDELGRHMFRTYGDGALVTAVDPDAWRLIETRELNCPLLKLIALGASTVPYAADKGVNWVEPLALLPYGPLAWFRLLIWPYVSHPFASLICTCTAAPNEHSSLLSIESKPATPSPGMPSRVLCHIERLRGPVKVEAFFDHGRIAFSMFSFEPGLPFERRDKPRG
jgi:murein DD-endopeptidase MepM/ murein hydrolase activator NlpD